MTHWVTAWIGTEWRADGGDCWGFARRVWREHYGIDVPAVPVDATDALACRRAIAGGISGWSEVTVPQEGAGVLMARGRRPCHVGIWVADLGAVLHSIEGAGAILTGPSDLLRMGYRITGFYVRAECARP